MNDAKKISIKQEDVLQSDVGAPRTTFAGVVNHEVDAKGIKFEIPSLPEKYFKNGDELTCLFAGGVVTDGVIDHYSDLDLAESSRSPRRGPVFKIRKGEGVEIETDSDAFWSCVIGALGDSKGRHYKGPLAVFYYFESNRELVYSEWAVLHVNFSE